MPNWLRLEYPIQRTVGVERTAGKVHFMKLTPEAISLIALLVISSVAGQMFCGDTAAQHDKCKSNLRTLGTACEMYSTDNWGRYPRRLQDLVPGYIKAIPTCPAADRDTYSPSFASTSNPDDYTIFCQGNNHRRSGCGINYPQYCASDGMRCLIAM